MTAQTTGFPTLTSTATRCPGCGSTYTTWVDAAGQDNFLCKTCGACWHPAAGHADRVDPQQCPGCSLRRICEAANGCPQRPVPAY
jgi:DNA-directed RNA polymerase subunit RPC12/RpoP